MEVQEKCIIFALANKENRSRDHLTIHRGVEQLAARRAHNPEVGGSSPPPATTTDNFGCPFSVCMPITRLQGVLGLMGLMVKIGVT